MVCPLEIVQLDTNAHPLIETRPFVTETGVGWLIPVIVTGAESTVVDRWSPVWRGIV